MSSNQDRTETGAEARGLVRIDPAAHALTPAQRKFNTLIAQIGQLRQQLADWRTFHSAYQQQLAEQYQPALARLREKQTAMARLLDGFLDGDALARHERPTVRLMLTQLLAQLLVDSQEDELVRLHDKHAPQSFADERQTELDVVRSLASEEFGVELDAVPDGGSADELADWIAAQQRARLEQPPPPRRRRKSAKADALEQAALGGTRALRELFRKLVSELHPDREADPLEQARKTGLMQRVNQAYKAGDLLALLELQLSIEQIDLDGLAVIAEERLRHYVHVLEGQSQRLREELTTVVAPFALVVQGVATRHLTPAIVRRTLKEDIRGIELMTRAVQMDLVRFKDVRAFKQSLRGSPLGEVDDGEPPASRRGRGRTRRR